MGCSVPFVGVWEPEPPDVYVTVSALDGGHLTLPERLFVTDADPEKRSTVPSLSFLIHHPMPSPTRPGASQTYIVFDLGIKRDIEGYTPAQRAHIAQRQPVITDPDCAASLRNGVSQADSGKTREDVLLDPATEIDYVILSHVHWDHVGTPDDFPNSTFLVGSGTQHLLRHGAGPLYPAELFNGDELPASRTVEFPPVPGTQYPAGSSVPEHTATPADTQAKLPPSAERWSWEPFANGHMLDLFGDKSVYVIDSPGHLYGHVNLLLRLDKRRYVYLGGDCCHDPRILSQEKGIAMYDDGRGGMRSVHVDTDVATKTLHGIRETFKGARSSGWEVEVVLAHDGQWREKNRHRFWPGKL